MVLAAPGEMATWLRDVVRPSIPVHTVNLLLYAAVLHPDVPVDVIRPLVLVPHLARCTHGPGSPAHGPRPTGPIPAVPPCLVLGYAFAVAQASGLSVERVQQWLNNEMAMYCVHRSMQHSGAPWAATWLGCLALFMAIPGQTKRSLAALRQLRHQRSYNEDILRAVMAAANDEGPAWWRAGVAGGRDLLLSALAVNLPVRNPGGTSTTSRRADQHQAGVAGRSDIGTVDRPPGAPPPRPDRGPGPSGGQQLPGGARRGVLPRPG